MTHAWQLRYCITHPDIRCLGIRILPCYPDIRMLAWEPFLSVEIDLGTRTFSSIYYGLRKCSVVQMFSNLLHTLSMPTKLQHRSLGRIRTTLHSKGETEALHKITGKTISQSSRQLNNLYCRAANFRLNIPDFRGDAGPS